MKFPAKVQSLDGIDLGNRRLHLAIGMFDGVHLGHQSVIESAVHSARSREAVAGVLTFWPHPSAFFRPEDPTRLIMDPAAKTRMFFELGAELVIEQPFDGDFARVPAEEFVSYLLERLPGLEAIYVGENWRFGRGRKGDVSLLVETARRQGVNVVSMPRLHFNGEPVSSSRIRELLTGGELEEANRLLGYGYVTEGEVRSGRGLGREIGYPTLNLPWNGDLRPQYGVYGVRVSPADERRAAGSTGSVAERARRGVANFGVRPTVTRETPDDPVLEVHLLEEDGCPFASGDRLVVEWLFFLRPEKRFGELDTLKEQIARDRAAAVVRFGT